jgi:oleandomycin transport system permease protein
MSTATITPNASTPGPGTPAVTAPRRTGGISPTAGLRHGLTITWRNLMRIKRSPESLLDLTLQPIIFIVLFVYLFGGAVAGSQHAYLQYLLPGLLVQTVVFASAGTGVGLADDINKGIFDRFRTLPIARWAPLFGTILSDVIRYVVTVAVVLGFGMILGYRPAGGAVGVIAGSLLVLAFAFALCWVIVLVALFVRKPQQVQGFVFPVMFPLTFGSNAFVQTSTLPGWLQSWVHVNPVTHLVNATRDLLGGTNPGTELLWSLGWIVGLVAVFAPLAVAKYRRT